MNHGRWVWGFATPKFYKEQQESLFARTPLTTFTQFHPCNCTYLIDIFLHVREYMHVRQLIRVVSPYLIPTSWPGKHWISSLPRLQYLRNILTQACTYHVGMLIYQSCAYHLIGNSSLQAYFTAVVDHKVTRSYGLWTTGKIYNLHKAEWVIHWPMIFEHIWTHMIPYVKLLNDVGWVLCQQQ